MILNVKFNLYKRDIDSLIDIAVNVNGWPASKTATKKEREEAAKFAVICLIRKEIG